MKNTITTAVVPVAGKGSRLYPLTQATPKELFTTLDGSIIEMIIRELIESGITKIILVTSPMKLAIKTHVNAIALPLTPSGEKVKIHFVNQNKIPGNGGSIISALPYTKLDPFIVVWGDELFLNAKIPRTKQLIDNYKMHQKPVIALTEVSDEDVSKCGIVTTNNILEDGSYQISNLLEKPAAKDTPSRLASVGGYIVTHEIINELKRTSYSADNELYLSKALQAYCASHTLLGVVVDAEWYETGSFAGYERAFIAIAEKRRN